MCLFSQGHASREYIPIKFDRVNNRQLNHLLYHS